MFRLEWLREMKLMLESQVFMQTVTGDKLWIFLQSWKLQSRFGWIICIHTEFLLHRNKFFVKFPGRELGGVFVFLKGFSNDAWLALAVFIVVIPAFLYFTYMVLMFFNLYESDNWIYGWNLLVFTAAMTQQV